MALSKYRSKEEAAYNVVKLLSGLIKYVEAIKPRIRWSDELENALKEPRKKA